MNKKHTIDIIFPVAVLFVFAASALIVLMLASNIYTSNSAVPDDNYTSRTAFAYVSERLRQNDEAGTDISAEGDKLVIRDGKVATYIYMKDGMLKELRVMDGATAGLDAGTDITAVQDFSGKTKDNKVYIDITTEDGSDYRVVSTKRSK